ncbi:MAG: tyrosine-type recombinase/integrase [Desulfamplus sp.]|nr:tyrosine-type recombinase/integrase [Desulfamplus sp.]
MSLTDTAIKALKPKDKPYKIYDGNGLYLLVNQTGKYFRYDYKFEGKRKTLAIGVYPAISLKDARVKCFEAKMKLNESVDPLLKEKPPETNYFKTIAMEWFDKQKAIWKKSHAETVQQRLDNHILPLIGHLEISTITTPMVLNLLKQIENKGIIETAHRVKQIMGQVFRYGIITGRAERDPSADLKGALTPCRPKNMSAITNPKEVGELLRAIDAYQGGYITKCALQLAPLVFVRPIELRHAEWSEIYLDNALWKIPSDKMKMKRIHIVPLAKQAIDILNNIKTLTGNGRYVFPSVRTTVRPMSENTVLAALRRMGFEKDEMTGHGFRAMASTLLHENNFSSHLIEMQLAHSETNSVRAAYNHAQYLKERASMMQWWADYLESLKATLSDSH